MNVHKNVNIKDHMVKNDEDAYQLNKLSLFTVEYGGYILKSHVSYGTGPIGTSELYMGPVP